MDVKNKVIEVVRQQGIVSGRINQLQEEANRHNGTLTRLAGQMEVLDEMFNEEFGMDLNSYLKKDEVFRKAVQEASQAGSNIAAGQQQQQPPPIKAVKHHAGNKQIPEKPVTRTKSPPKVVVTDEPPIPDADDDD